MHCLLGKEESYVPGDAFHGMGLVADIRHLGFGEVKGEGLGSPRPGAQAQRLRAGSVLSKAEQVSAQAAWAGRGSPAGTSLGHPRNLSHLPHHLAPLPGQGGG